MEGSDSLDQDDRLRFRMLMDQLFYGWTYNYLSTTETNLTALKKFILPTLAQSGGRDYWERGKSKFDQRFVAWVEDCRREQDA